jgi:hypothetical protein
MAKTGGPVKRLREIQKRKGMVVSHGGFTRFAKNDQDTRDRRAGGSYNHGNNTSNVEDLVALAAAALANNARVIKLGYKEPAKPKYDTVWGKHLNNYQTDRETKTAPLATRCM